MEAITFILSDENINEYGFRVLTGGIDLTSFKKNPVMLYAHIRAFERNSGKPMFPIGKWANVRLDDSKPYRPLIADAIMDHDGPDEVATTAAHKVKNGFLNTASVYLDIIEISEDPALMMQGQTMPTIVKSVLKEASIADIPGNGNCCRLVLNYQGNEVRLNGGDMDADELSKLFSHNKPKQESMKVLIAKLNSLKLNGVSLADNATEAEVLNALGVLEQQNVALTSKVTAKDTEIGTLNSTIESLKLAAATAEQKANDDKAIALVENGISGKKLMPAQKDAYVKLAKADYDSTKSIIDGLKPYEKVSTKLTSGDESEDGDDNEKLVAKHIKLHKEGKLAALKLSDPAEYIKLHKARYGTEPKI